MDTTQEQDYEAIASRAYTIFLDRQREGAPGDDISDWYAAVRELKGDPVQRPQETRRKRQAV